MGFPFHVTEHVIDAQYIRDNARATATANAPLKLCIKQYTPLDNTNPQPGDVTFIAAHGIGFPKELYEPLWEGLLARSKQDGFRIRAIWIADAVNQGASGIVNEHILGNDNTWSDNSRDVLHMISHFRTEMPQPIMGVAHSAGAVSLTFAALFHPRLFASLLLVEPFISDRPHEGGGAEIITMATLKRDTWPSREAAAKESRKFLRVWDPRVFQRWTEFGYRELPTAIYPSAPATPGAVTLTTTKHQEIMSLTYINQRENIIVHVPGENRDENEAKQRSPVPERQVYRTEPMIAFKMLPYLAPPTLWISGSRSPLYTTGIHEEAAKITGKGFQGNVGVASGVVNHVVIEKGNHTLPLEKIDATAAAMGPWIQREVQRWKQNEAQTSQEWGPLSSKEKSTIPLEWMETLKIAKANL
ncbi:hypothetical protein N7466_009316 [Penicillium verhagenii]|uniref:uncharacterized protein n=1 Tax=Penicillium verhagenii TaxID=1562060 RepID=UPI002545A6F2|nr:uncharacterized protein N7466_009316 [Penicillium verhagenii]KAJ5920990.1 hypothetical protein N7466_009316 [Penicillium verhagenii]